MRAFLDNMLKQIKEFFGKMTRRDKIRLAILIVVIIVLAIVAVKVLNRTNYETMYTAQNELEARAIYQALMDMNEPADIEGTRILVPEGSASELRSRLAAQGVLDPDDINYDLLDTASGFNMTSEQAKQYNDAQKAREIRMQILKSDKVSSAIVTVNSGEYSPFVASSGVRAASATVMLTVRSGVMLSSQEAQAIADLVKTSVPGIEYENISITDSKLNHYQIGEDSVDIGTELNTRIALQNLLTQQYKLQGEQLLVPIFGADNVLINVNLRLNFDKKVTESVEYSPSVPGEIDGIVRSSSEMYESQRSAAAAEGIPGTDSNAMGTVEYPYGTLEDGEQYRRALLENNYEIDETRTRIEHEQGTIETISVAVAINSEAVIEDFTDKVVNIVSKGLGITENNIAVEYAPFLYQGIDYEKMQKEMDEYNAQEKRKEMLQTIIMWVVILLLGLALISLVKSIVKTMRGPIEPEEPEFADGGIDIDLDYVDYIDYIADDDISDVIEPEEVVLNTKSSSLEQIEKFIDKDPVAVAQLLRNWLTDE